MKNRKEIDRRVFEDLYFGQGLALRTVATRLGISEPTVRNRFKSHGLILREHGSWAIKYAKNDFDGSEQDRAYILGFRVGDLNVYTTSKTSKVIIARTNSTHNHQIQLMRSLFGKYGGVTVCGKGISKNVNCYLNRSFSFLHIAKPYQVDTWIKAKTQNSLAFMAGYIDAEGNFILNQGKARFKIDSYDEDILFWMHEWFLRKGIRSKLRLLGKQGSARYGGGVWNNNLWRLNVNEANSLSNLCKLVSPFLRHKKRIDDVNKCEENIMHRKANGTI